MNLPQSSKVIPRRVVYLIKMGRVGNVIDCGTAPQARSAVNPNGATPQHNVSCTHIVNLNYVRLSAIAPVKEMKMSPNEREGDKR